VAFETAATPARSRRDGTELESKVRDLWRRVSQVPDAFGEEGVLVAEREHSKLCAAGWVGIVRLGEAAVVVAPSPEAAERLRADLAGCTAHEAVDPDHLAKVLPGAELIGPAELGYADASTARLLLSAGIVQATLDDAGVDHLLERSGPEDAVESGLAYVTSPLFVVRDGGECVAAAGYRVWVGTFAHLGVLTDPGRRGEGLAHRASSAAAAHALGHNLVLQWRARPADSRAVARSLGFREVGSQVNLRLPD
jgi:hypothetical protein